jgi:hypothetical protein
MRTLRTIAAALLVLATATPQLIAQDSGLPPPRAQDPTQRDLEWRYAQNFGHGGEPPLKVEHLSGSLGGDGPGPSKVSFEGVRASSPTRTIERLKLGSVDEARVFAAHYADTDHGPTLVEQRGDQVVTVRDPALRENPAQVEAYRKLIWGVLPAPSGPTESVGFIDHDKGDVVASASSGPVHDLLRKRYDEARELSRKDPASSARNDDGSYSVKLESAGLTANVAPDATWATSDAARGPMLARMLAALRTTKPGAPTTLAPAASATRGAASVLDGIGR